ncbi:MAG: hypothetical protein K2N87_18990 [Eubacterium sp.]|nr:hypothetical protein [Eubacterium sp.]
MKDRKYICVLLLEAAALLCAGVLHIQFSGVLFRSAAPFEQLGQALRTLSLSSEAGNTAAVALYVLLGLVPCAAYVLLRLCKKACRIDLLLPGLSVLLYLVLYYAVNPGLLGLAASESAKWMPGAVFYSALFGYLALRALHAYAAADAGRLYQGLLRLLGLLAVIFVYAVFGKYFEELLSSIQALREMRPQMGYRMGTRPYVSSLSLTWSYVFLVLQFIVRALPYVLDLLIIRLAVLFVRELQKDRYSDGAVLAAARLAGCCAKALAATVVTGVIFNILQLAAGNRLYQVHITVTVPVASVLFVVAVLLAVRYIQEAQSLKQDNDLFI